MSRASLLKRMERLERILLDPDFVFPVRTEGLRDLSDEQLAAWCILLEEGGVASRPQSEQVALWERVLSDPDYVAAVLAVLAEHESSASARPPSS